jgi:hypothetical protein
MFAHGIMTGLFFALVGLVYERAHSRHVPGMGGFAKTMPGGGGVLHARRPLVARHARHARASLPSCWCSSARGRVAT